MAKNERERIKASIPTNTCNICGKGNIMKPHIYCGTKCKFVDLLYSLGIETKEEALEYFKEEVLPLFKEETR